LTQLDLGLKKIGKRAEALPRKGFIPSLDEWLCSGKRDGTR